MVNNFVSDEQRKAVMASLNNHGLIKFRPCNNYSLSRIIANVELHKIQLEETKKRLEEIKREIELEEVEKKIEQEIEAFEEKQRLAIEKEIKRVLYRKKPKKYETIMSHSFEIDGIIREAVKLGIDRNTILKLRKKHQQLVKLRQEYYFQ